MKRRLASVLLGLCLLAIPLPALAKLPPFAIDVEPDTPTVGEPVTVTVELTQSVPVEKLEGLIAFFRAEDAESRVRGTPVPLNRVGETTYQAVVVLPEAGEWRIVSFPDRSGWPTDEVPDGYPDQIPIQVGAGGQSETSELVVGFGLLLGAAALIGWKAVRSETKPSRTPRPISPYSGQLRTFGECKGSPHPALPDSGEFNTVRVGSRRVSK